jgi:uncharacterized membrane protein
MAKASKPRNRILLARKTRWRNIALVAMIAFYAAVSIVDLSFIFPLLTKDAETVARIAGGEIDVTGRNSYVATAFLSNVLGSSLRPIFQGAVGVSFIAFCLWPLRQPLSLAVVSLLLIPPILFFLTQFNKDTVLVTVIISSCLILTSDLSLYKRYALVSSIYILYALFFREYYLLIIGVFIASLAIRRLNLVFAISLATLLVAALLLVPSDVFSQLQSSRDAFNQNRIRFGAVAGGRTAFMNPLPPTDLFSFVVNYIYAFVRLNVPVLFGTTARDLFLFVNIAIYGWVITKFLGYRRNRATTPLILFVSHISVLIIFEPDLGSYLRHVSSALPYCIPAFNLIDQRSAIASPRAPRRRLDTARAAPRRQYKQRGSQRNL